MNSKFPKHIHILLKLSDDVLPQLPQFHSAQSHDQLETIQRILFSVTMLSSRKFALFTDF